MYKMGRPYAIILTLFLTSQLSEPARILMVPLYHYSHVNMFSTAGKALLDAGHDVTVFTNKTFEKTPQKMGLKSIIYTLPSEISFGEKLMELSKEPEVTIGLAYKTATNVFPCFGQSCEHILGDEKLILEIKNQKFDLFIMDGVPPLNCLFTLPYKFDVRYISLNALLDPWSAGVTGLPSLEPIQMLPHTNHQTFFQRLQTFAMYFVIYGVPELTISGDYYVKKYAPEKTPITTHMLYRKSEMFLVNHDVICLDYPRVSAPNYVFIGGSSARAPQPLADDVKTFVEGAEYGIIVMSFGSVKAWQNLWTTMKPKMIHALSKVKQRVLILYGLDDTQGFPPNVKTMKWLPQNDLLAHPKAKLFITHGGNNGQLEAAYHGVPMVIIPIGGDQKYSGIRSQHRGYGRVLLEGIDTDQEEISQAIQEVLANQSYTDNIKKCSAIIRSEPSTKEKIVHWVEHILKFGGDHLRSAGSDLSIFQVLMVDIIIFLLIVILVQLGLCYCCCKLTCRRLCRSKPKDKVE